MSTLLQRCGWIALAASAGILAGCGGSGSHGSASTTTPARSPLEAKATVDRFLYGAGAPARDCRETWIPTARRACMRSVRKLKAMLAHGFVLPKRGALPYRLAGVNGRAVTLEAGDRQPDPAKGRPQFYGVFLLRLYGGSWRIAGAG
jgi:hypothetical protein